MKLIFFKIVNIEMRQQKTSLFFFEIYFEVKYKCVYLHSLSERALSQGKKDSSLKR